MARLKLPVIMLCCFTIAALALSRTPQKKSLDGIWLSDGYGNMYEINGDTIRFSQYTAVSCIQTGAGKRVPGSAGDVFAMDGSSRKIDIIAGSSDDEKQINNPSAASNIFIKRVSQKPAACLNETPNTPESNFETLWTTFKEQHGFLKERGVDWDATYRKYRPQVTANTAPEELFRIGSEMIDQLKDAHTSLRWDATHQFRGRRPDPNPLSKEDQQKTLDIIKSKYVRGELRSWCDNKVMYGRLNDTTGYFRVSSFSGYVPNGTFEEGSADLSRALDAVVNDKGIKTLVIDVRLNTGGSDAWGVQIASWLSDTRYLAYTKRARNDPKDPTKWTKPQSKWVLPASGPHFTGKVIELIGRDCISAGETFSMALMGRKPAVIRIGEPTQGVYSDVLGRILPNGWNFGLPNEVFLNEAGKHFEVRGVPPDIKVPVFPREDLQAGRDSGIEKALEIAAQKSP
jgi:hypothetical protein